MLDMSALEMFIERCYTNRPLPVPVLCIGKNKHIVIVLRVIMKWILKTSWFWLRLAAGLVNAVINVTFKVSIMCVDTELNHL